MSTVAALPAGRPIWVDLMTTDAAAARDFYAALLGWQYDVSGPEYGHYAMASAGGRNAAGIGQIMPGQEMPPAWTVYFGTEDADATCARVVEAGGQVMVPPMDVGDFGRMAVCADSTGAVFGLWQPKRHVGMNVVDEHGAWSWCEVNTRDLDAAAAFYARVFDLAPEAADTEHGRYTMFRHGGEPVCGALQMTPEWGDMPPHWMTYFCVDDLDATLGAVAAHGGRVAHGPFEIPYGTLAVVIDPQGAAVTFMQPPAGGMPPM